MFALKTEHISKGKASCFLSSFIFIDFGFLSELTAQGGDSGNMRIGGDPVTPGF